MSKSKQIGTLAETAVVRYLREHGFGMAERRALRGADDAGDITGTPGICWEIKGGQAAKIASQAQVDAWLSDTDREAINSGSRIGILVMQRAGYGPLRCGQWWAVTHYGSIAFATRSDRLADMPVHMSLEAMVMVLRESGYGDPL